MDTLLFVADGPDGKEMSDSYMAHDALLSKQEFPKPQFLCAAESSNRTIMIVMCEFGAITSIAAHG